MSRQGSGTARDRRGHATPPRESHRHDSTLPQQSRPNDRQCCRGTVMRRAPTPVRLVASIGDTQRLASSRVKHEEPLPRAVNA